MWMLLKKWKLPAVAGISAILLILTMNTFNFMLLFWAFFAGVSAAVFLLRPGYQLPNLLLTKYQSLHSDKLSTSLRTSCSVCGLQNCTREKSDSTFETLQPWIGIEVNERVDDAITEFLERLLETYVWNWYRNLSDDETFVHELKVALRHCLAVLYRRISKIDVAEVIIKKLLHVAMIHLHVCMSAMKAGCKTEEEIIMWYGPKIHTALKSRRSELDYIRAMCDSVFPFICSPSLIESEVGRSFLRELLSSNVILYGIDSMEDPDKINHLLLLFFDKAPPRQADQPPSPMVPFLDKFASKDASDSLLYIELPKIMTTQDNQDMLYQFMSFLKTVGAVHHLQFCLTVDDFNRRCLSQDQDERQQIKLHSEAKEIFNTYCRPDSPTFIHFNQDIINELRDVANGHPCEVNRLRTSAPLFLAYDHVYNLLEHIYCPLFYQSDTYYKMICGERRPVKAKKPLLKQSTAPSLERSDSARSSLRMKKEAKEGSRLNDFSESLELDQDSNLIDDEDKSAQLIMEDEIQEDFLINRDLSTWRIEIPKIELMRREDLASRSSASTNERIYAFYIEIKRVDVQEEDDEPDHWSVLRRYSEFYVLESKLMEFHGSLGIINLPTRKILGRNFEFLDSKRSDFEKFLKALISQPRLRHSELLFDFLCLERGGAGSNFDTKFLPDVKLGRLFRRVPTKLLKERGQHLSLFLQSFIQSCEPSKPKPGKYEPITDNPEIQMDHKLHNDLYPEGDWMFDSFQSAELAETNETISFFTGVCDYLIFIGVEVFKADSWLHHAMTGVKKLFQATIEPYAYNYLKAKIATYRQEHHVVDVIHAFRDVVFDTSDQPRTEKDRRERREQALKEWEEFIPGAFTYLIGSERHKEGCEKMFNLLQKPKLNKQLGYLLLDCLLLELFPELHSPSSD